jgi:hypothetical protein
MLTSKFFGLNRTQATLDFVNVHVDKDIPVFLDPLAIRSLGTEWAHHCVSLLQNYFETVLACMRADDHDRARQLLACLNERNEFHIGYSKGRSRGHGFGEVSAERIWKSLSKSKAATTGILSDLEDTILFVEGVGPDMLSDAVCNIIRGPLIKYTQDMCVYYGIPLHEEVDSGPVWNPQDECWEHTLLSLPLSKHGGLILIPKVIARVRQTFHASEYYRHYLMPVMQEHHKSINSSLVHVLRGKKNKGKKKVYKRDLYQRYGADKLASAKLTAQHPEALAAYRRAKGVHPSRAIDHQGLAELQNTAPPDFATMVASVSDVQPGNEQASAYEDVIEKLLSALLYPSLSFPVKQHRIHDGRKQIDITYANTAKDGFFHWAATHYPAAHVFVECKNYGREVGNPEVDQLAGRFSPTRGRVGLLVLRSVENKLRLLERCRDTSRDDRGFIIPLDDADLQRLVNERSAILYGHGPNLLLERFRFLIS